MLHDLDLILTITAGLSVALGLGLLTHRLHLSPIVGYLIAGVVIGPFTPGYAADPALANQLAELGVILLMFGVGLHFDARDLFAVRGVAVPGAIGQIAAATGLGVVVAVAFGWSIAAGVVFGLAISVASTVVLLRVLEDHDALHTPGGHIAVGWLVIEDLFTVVVLVVLPLVAGPRDGGGAALALALTVAMLKLAAMVGVMWLVGRLLIPRLLRHVAQSSRELFSLTVLVLALGLAVASALLFGASMALGAFLAGMIVGQSELSQRAASDALPMRDAFAVLFFVSVGMLLDPSTLIDEAPLIAATTAIVVVGKASVAYVMVRVLGHPPRTRRVVAVALAQVGEFSFILAGLGLALGVVPAIAVQVIVATAILTITINPLLFRWFAAADAPVADAPAPVVNGAEHRVIVVGHGPVGETLTTLLRDNAIAPTVIDMNPATVAALRANGFAAVLGDAREPAVLEEAGVADATSLIFAGSGTPPEDVIAAARAANPELHVLARAAHLRDLPAVRRAGAETIVVAEAEVALAMTERLLADLGAGPDQLDRVRDRVRADLSSG